MSNRRLEGKVILVTGGARGQGEAHARLLAGEGATVIVADIREEQAAAVASLLGNGSWCCGLNVASEADWKDLFEAIVTKHGRLDALVNNAGIAVMANLDDTDLALFERTISVNQTGTFLGMKYGAALMRRGHGGSIVNISSIAGLKADPMFFAYSASKWAVRGMTKAAARGLAPEGIRVNTIFPGIIDTPMLTEAAPGLDVATFGAENTPLGRAGIPDDVASAVLFLVSDDSRFVTGTELAVDGGITA